MVVQDWPFRGCTTMFAPAASVLAYTDSCTNALKILQYFARYPVLAGGVRGCLGLGSIRIHDLRHIVAGYAVMPLISAKINVIR